MTLHVSTVKRQSLKYRTIRLSPTTIASFVLLTSVDRTRHNPFLLLACLIRLRGMPVWQAARFTQIQESMMALADLGSPAAKIHSSLEDLQLAWANTLEQWHDDNSRRFEEEALMPLALTIKLSLDAIGRMNESLQKAERAVE